MDKSTIVIGVDFDNTIAGYDKLMLDIASANGFAIPDNIIGKKALRDFLRKQEDGEIKWMKVQVQAYGQRMQEAEPIDGVMDFFLFCRDNGIPTRIISHKTKYAHGWDESRTNLREAAIRWLDRQGFFKSNRYDLSEKLVFFESTRQKKIGRIIKMDCTHFIDDLVETFDEPLFPADVKQILFDRQYKGKQSGSNRAVCATWEAIINFFLKSNE